MPNNLTGQNISDTYQRLLQIQGGVLTDGTGSIVTVPSASYAVSSSHEIIYELSSSHAELADNATNLTGLTTTVTELNYLDGISSAQGTYVKSMDQDVQQAASPTFRTSKASLLFQHTYADAGPAKPTMTNSEGTVAFYIPSNTSTRLFGWLRENTEMCFINPSGNFSGQLISPVTSSGDVSASGTLIANQANIIGHITASGDISASGNIIGNNLFMKDHVAVAETSNAIAFGFENNTAIQIGKSKNPTKIIGHVTASSNISASGDITANNLTIAGDITSVGDDVSIGDDLLFTSAGAIIKFMGTTGGNSEGVAYKDQAGTERFGLIFPGSNIVALANRAINGTVQVRANDGTAGSGGEHIVATFDDEKVNIGNAIYLASGSGHITASGNISASGLNHYLGGVVNGSRFRVDGAGYLDSDPTNSSGLFLSNDTRINGPVTASGNISASGNIKGHAIISKENIAAEWNGIAMLLGTYGKPTTLRGTSTTLNNGNLILSDSSNGHITASGNITASQIKANEYKNQKVVLVQHSFAIARSSINGTYAGDGTEYLQGNTTWGVSDRAWVGNYGDTPDTGFDPTHIQNAYVIPYDVTNLRCDVMLESNKCATNGSESGSFFLFKKAFTGDSYGNSTEALRRIGMNFTLYDHANDGETAYPIFSVSSSGRLSGGNNNPISMSRGDLLFPFYKENVNAGETGHARGTFTITAEII